VSEPPRLLRDLDRTSGFTLWVEGAEQSYVDTADPTHLEFEYMQHIALVVDLVFDGHAPLAALHLGGGACTLARWVAATRPGSRQTVVEASAEILRAVQPLGPVPGTRIVHADGIERLRKRASNRLDLVIWDMYDGPRVVTSTLTLDVLTHMERVLAPGGIAVLNVSDMTPFEVARPVVAALRVVFADVALLAEPSILRGRRSGNCVLVGATRRLPLLELRRAASAAPVRARLLADAALDEFVGDALPPTEESPLPLPDEKLGRGFL
jgi:spermidine synthase